MKLRSKGARNAQYNYKQRCNKIGVVKPCRVCFLKEILHAVGAKRDLPSAATQLSRCASIIIFAELLSVAEAEATEHAE